MTIDLRPGCRKASAPTALLIAALLAGGGTGPSAALALTPVSGEVLASTNITFNDEAGLRSAGISDTGSVVVAWNGRSTAPSPGDVDRVLARRYDALGVSLGSPFFLDPISTGPTDPEPADRRLVSFSMNDEGEFVASWAENVLISTQVFQQTYLRWFDAAGAGQTGGVPVAVSPGRKVYQTDVALANDGRTVVGWSGYLLSNSLQRQFRVYPSPGGLPVGPEVTVAQDTMPFDQPNQASRIETYMRDDGTFLYSYRLRGSDTVIRLKPYDANGQSPGADILPAGLGGGGVTPLRLTGDGHLLGVRFATAGPAIFAKAYDPSLNQLFDSSLIPNSILPIAFAADRADSGEMTVAFIDQLGGTFRVFVRSYDRNGNPQGGVTSISSPYIPSLPANLSIDMNESGQAVVAWSVPDFPENPTPGMYLRTFTYNRTPNAVVADGQVFSASAACSAAVSAAALDAGSNDPDGLPADLTYSLSPAGPFGIGPHTVTFTVTDPQGASDSVPVSFTVVDDLPPTGLNAPTAGGAFINTLTPTITWNAAQDCQAVTYALQVGTTADGSNIANLLGIAATSQQVTLPGDGTYFARARATDASANAGAFTASTQFVVDRVLPTVPGTPAAASAFTNNQSVTFTWAPSTDANFSTHDVQIGTTPGGSNVFNGTAAGGTLATTLGADGPYYIRVRGRDLAGNVSGWSSNGLVTLDRTLPTRPGEPLAAQTPLALLEVPLTWAASTDANLASYELRVGTSPGGTNIFNGVIPATAAFTVTVPGDDTYYTRVRALDLAGNVSSFSNIGSFESDTTGPTAPGAPSVTTNPTANPTVTFTWTAATDATSVASYELQVGSAEGASDYFSANVGGVLLRQLTLPADGEAFARVRGIDGLGNVGAWSPTGTVTIDTAPPAIAPGGDLAFAGGNDRACELDATFTVTFTEPVRTFNGVGTVAGLLPIAVSLANSTADASGLSVEVTGSGAGPYTIRVFGDFPVTGGDLVVSLDGAPIRDSVGNVLDPAGLSATLPTVPCTPNALYVY